MPFRHEMLHSCLRGLCQRLRGSVSLCIARALGASFSPRLFWTSGSSGFTWHLYSLREGAVYVHSLLRPGIAVALSTARLRLFRIGAPSPATVSVYNLTSCVPSRPVSQACVLVSFVCLLCLYVVCVCNSTPPLRSSDGLRPRAVHISQLRSLSCSIGL